MSNGFFSLPRALYELPAWIGAKLKYRALFHEIAARVVWKEQEYNANGHKIILKPGQYCSSLRRMMTDFNPQGLRGKATEDTFSKNDIEGGIQYFLYHRLLRQEIRHDVTILTICLSGICEEFDKINQTDNQTEIRQKSDTKEESNKEIRIKKEKIKKEKIILLEEQAVGQDFSQSEIQHNVDFRTFTLEKPRKSKSIEEKIKFRDWVALTQKEYDSLIQKHGLDFANAMLDALDSHNTSRQEHYKSDYGALKIGGWVYEKISKLREKSKSSFSQSDVDYAKEVHAKFNGKIKTHSIELGHNYIEFSPRGGNAQPLHLKFEENGFRQQVESFLRKCGAL